MTCNEIFPERPHLGRQKPAQPTQRLDEEAPVGCFQEFPHVLRPPP